MERSYYLPTGEIARVDPDDVVALLRANESKLGFKVDDKLWELSYPGIERRCKTCGARVQEGKSWCFQCFTLWYDGGVVDVEAIRADRRAQGYVLPEKLLGVCEQADRGSFHQIWLHGHRLFCRNCDINVLVGPNYQPTDVGFKAFKSFKPTSMMVKTDG